MHKANELPTRERERLLKTLHARFEVNMNRHPDIEWATVQARLESSSSTLWSLNEMERTGGEPDVVVLKATSAAYTFIDCAAQSPKGRRSVCYDRAALEARKEHK